MGEYRIGKDVGALKARVDALEARNNGCSCVDAQQAETAHATSLLTLEQYEHAIAGNFIFKTNALLLLRTGRIDQLVEYLEDSLQEELAEIMDFEESNVRTVAFYNAGQVDAQSEQCLFVGEDLIGEIRHATKGIAKAQSTTCHPTKNCTGGRWCFRIPWSLKAVDVNKNGIWRFIKGSNCGFTLRGNGCGEPVTGSVCID